MSGVAVARLNGTDAGHGQEAERGDGCDQRDDDSTQIHGCLTEDVFHG
jgi:hypothetical protein